MSRVAGLELDQDCVRIAIFEGTSKKHTLVDFIEESLEGETPEERAEHLETFLRELKARKENRGIEFVTCLDSRRTVLREISVPFVKDDQIAKTVRFEAEGYLHAYAIDDVVIEFLKCSSSEDSSRLLICAAPKKVIQERLDGMKSLGVDPSVLELDVTALATSFSNTPLYSEDQNVLLVHADEHSTRLVFLERGRVVKIRSIWSHKAPVEPVEDAATFESSYVGPDGPSDVTASESEAGDNAPPAFDAGVDLQDEIAKRFEAIERSLEELDHEEDAPDDLPFVVLSDDDYASLQDEPGEAGGSGSAGDSSESSDSAFSGSASSDSVASDSDAADSESALVPVTAAAEAEEPTDGVLTRSQQALARFGPVDPIEKIVLEIERTFASYVLNNSIDLVVVSGDQAKALGLVRRLEEQFEVDTTSFDLGDSFPISWNGDPETLVDRGVVACGLGLRALGRGLTTFDLRKDEFRFEKRFARLMPALALVGMLLTVLGLFVTLEGRSDFLRYRKERIKLVDYQKESATSFFGELPTNAPVVPDWSRTVREKIRQISKGGGSKVTSFVNPIAMLNDLTTSVGKAGSPVYWQITDIDLRTELKDGIESQIRFLVDDRRDGQRVANAIKKHSDIFADARPTMDQTKDGSRFECTLYLTFKVDKNARKRRG